MINPRSSGADRPIWFVGDLGDPSVAAILRALPAAQTRRLDCPGNLPKPWPALGRSAPRVVIVHRAHLGGTDAERLARLRRRLGPDRRVILCVGPHARYADIERWAALVDLVLPEATAAETIARHVDLRADPAPLGRAGSATPPVRTVAAVSTNFELRSTWGAILRSAGYEVIEATDLAAPPDQVGAVWDVPVLEPDWVHHLTCRVTLGPVVAAIGFLDRTTRDLARQAGASACLDLPGDLVDLVRAVDRMVGVRRDPAHPGNHAPIGGPDRSRRAKR